MAVPDALSQLSAMGVRLARDGESIRATPRSLLTDEARELIRTHKAELLAALPADGGHRSPPDHAAEPRRQRPPAMSAGCPDSEYAEKVAELRRLVEVIARMAPAYWTVADIEEAVTIGATDLDNALATFRALAAEYGVRRARQCES